MILEVSGSFRTDTARTVLSMKNDDVAGHTHSGLPTNGQSEAHDVLREPIMDIAKLDPKSSPGLTKESIACVLGAMTVSSMAPAESIESSDITDNGKKRSRDNNAPGSWEAKRNTVKERVNFVLQSLTPDEKSFVFKYAGDFMSEISKKRGVEIGRATSPTRNDKVKQPVSGFVGGGYLSPPTASSAFGAPPKASHFSAFGTPPTASHSSAFGATSTAVKNVDVFPPKLVDQLGFYMTQPFRTDRW
jgi:hypothetical protein